MSAIVEGFGVVGTQANRPVVIFNGAVQLSQFLVDVSKVVENKRIARIQFAGRQEIPQRPLVFLLIAPDDSPIEVNVGKIRKQCDRISSIPKFDSCALILPIVANIAARALIFSSASLGYNRPDALRKDEKRNQEVSDTFRDAVTPRKQRIMSCGK